MSLPLSTSNADDVQAEDGQRAENDHAGRDVDPLSDVRSEDDCSRACSEVESKFYDNARDDDVCGTADSEDDAVQRASFRVGASSRLLRLLAERFQHGRVGGRSDLQSNRSECLAHLSR